MPQANSHSTWIFANKGGYRWQFANCGRRQVIFLQREIRTVPLRSKDDDTRLGGRGLLWARAGVTARAAKVVKERRSGSIGRVADCWRRARPSDHARACVCGRQFALGVRTTLTRRRARAGGCMRACFWVRVRVRAPGLRKCLQQRLEQHMLGLPSPAPCGAGFVKVSLPRRQRENCQTTGRSPRGRITPCLARGNDGSRQGASPCLRARAQVEA